MEGGERECGCGRRATTASFIPNRQGLRRHAGQQGVVPRCKHTYTGSLPVTRTRSLLPQSFLTSLAGCLLMPVVSSYELRRYLRYASRSSLCSSLLLFPLTTQQSISISNSRRHTTKRTRWRITLSEYSRRAVRVLSATRRNPVGTQTRGLGPYTSKRFVVVVAYELATTATNRRHLRENPARHRTWCQSRCQ